MQRYLPFFRLITKHTFNDYFKSTNIFVCETRSIASSPITNDKIVITMESCKETNSGRQSQDLTSNVTYAQVLSKQAFNVNDASNNNPSQANEVFNGNVSISANDDVSAINEPKQMSKLDLSDVSQSDSYEDAEDSLNVNSSSTVKSSDFASNTTEISSSVNIDSNRSKLVDETNSASSEYSESEEEEDLEDEAVIVDEFYPDAMRGRIRSNKKFDLPETVTVLETSHGSKVFLVGTAHFSEQSQEDVAKTIRAVQPDVVMLELCKHRVNILSLDEATILEESKNMNFQKVKAAIEQNGFLQGTLYFLILNMSAHLTKQLGMAPGGEFRRAFIEAKQVPGCLVQLGDRPIHITLQRALATLSWWQKLRVAWFMLSSKDSITKEEVERCKQKDLLEEMLAEMTGKFPELSHVFVKERDIYLAYSLQMATAPVPCSTSSHQTVGPNYVVGVVGMGHVPGIKENWGKISEKDIPSILIVPEPSMSSKIIRGSLKYSLLGLCLYGAYKVFPKSWIPTVQIANLFQR